MIAGDLPHARLGDIPTVLRTVAFGHSSSGSAAGQRGQSGHLGRGAGVLVALCGVSFHVFLLSLLPYLPANTKASVQVKCIFWSTTTLHSRSGHGLE